MTAGLVSTDRREFARGTYLDVLYPWGVNVRGRALCSDGKVRALARIASTADTFFSVPAAVEVRKDGKRYRVSGYITVETLAGYSTGSDDDPTVLKFVAVTYRKNHAALPAGAYQEETNSVTRVYG